MARYQIPPDPRDPQEKRPRRQRRDSAGATSWRYLLLGVIVTIVSIVIAMAIGNALLSRPPLTAGTTDPTLIILTAPPTAIPSRTPSLPTPSPIPTFTPIPTPDTATAPEEITVGFYAIVANTEGAGVTVRGGPSTSNASLIVADEGQLVLVIGGPDADDLNNRIWWQIELADGTQGWAAGEFFEPAAAPPR